MFTRIYPPEGRLIMTASLELTIEERLVRVTAGSVTIEGNLNLPEKARAVVLFAHGSGSSRHSSRNRYVARLLNEAKLATLLIDLLNAAGRGDRPTYGIVSRWTSIRQMAKEEHLAVVVHHLLCQLPRICLERI
jgi:hypothetical protein